MYFNVIIFITILRFTSVPKRVAALSLHPNVADDISADYENNEKDEPKKDLRRSFLEKKKLNEEQNVNVKLLKGLFKYPKNSDVVYHDDIPHYKVYNRSKIHRAVKKLDNEFTRLLRMINYKYIYKRDRHWRTWREVKYPNGTKIVFNYKSHNLVDINPNCTNCVTYSGFWDLEEKPPPCPYEIFSMKTASLICGITHQTVKDNFTDCPVKIKFIDLISQCPNPVVTKWKFEKLYSKRVSKTTSAIGGRDVFEIVTLYWIRRGEIIYQLINSTNEVVYSKIIRPANIIYVCIEDCGIFNPTTLKITKKDAPLSLDLLNGGHNAKKRENENGGKKKKCCSKKNKLTTTTPFKIIIQCGRYDSDSDYLIAAAGVHEGAAEQRKKNTEQKQKTTKSMCRRLIVKSKAAEIESDMDSDNDVDYSY